MYINGEWISTDRDFYRLDLITWEWEEIIFFPDLPLLRAHQMIACSIEGASGTSNSTVILLIKDQNVYAAQLSNWSVYKVADLDFNDSYVTRAVATNSSTVYVFQGNHSAPIDVSMMTFKGSSTTDATSDGASTNEDPSGFLGHEQVIISVIYLVAIITIVLSFGGGINA